MKRITALLMTFVLLFACASCQKNAEEIAVTTSSVTYKTGSGNAQSESPESAVNESKSSSESGIAHSESSKSALSSAATLKATASAFVTTLKTTAARVKRTTVRTPYVEPTDPATTVKATAAPKTSSVRESKTAAPESNTAQAPVIIQPQKHTCTISISCASVLANSDKLKKEKAPFVPKDGIILRETTVEFTPGETVFDILKRACASGHCADNCKYCQAGGIQLEFEYTPGYDNYYIEGIHQIYEKDCGSKSGWMYKVNGAFPNEGCSSYTVKDGDKIEFVYTCDLGNDVGA